MAISKITLNGVTQMDVTQKTVTANTMLNGVTSLKNDGTDIAGNIQSKTSSNLTASGATVTAPAGYYASDASASVASGTAGTPTASKGTVSNHAISITPSVVNTTGYITGGTKTGTAVSVSASELVSGTKSISSSGTTDVTNYASASVADGSLTVSASKGTVSSHSISVSPYVDSTSGFVGTGRTSGTAVTVSASELVSGTLSITSSGTKDVTNYASASVAAGTEGTPVATKGSAKMGSWVLGTIDIDTGAEVSSTTRMHTSGYIELTNLIDISTTGAAEFSVRAYKADYSFVLTDTIWHSGTINVDSFLQSYSSYSQIKYIRFNARYSTNASVVVSELEQLITVTDHTLSVTPSVTNSAGYISGGTHTGTGVTVAASELVSGSQTLTQNGTFDVTNLASVLVATPLVSGTFTGTTSGAAIDVNIPYSGNGYPIAIIIFPTEGPFNEESGSYYSYIGQNAIAMVAAVKSRTDIAPLYGSNETRNHMITVLRYKSSTTSATSYSQGSIQSYAFQNADAAGTAAGLLRLKTNTTMSVFIRSTSYGFAPNIEYTYKIIYSE